jgi:hypothetical protein
VQSMREVVSEDLLVALIAERACGGNGRRWWERWWLWWWSYHTYHSIQVKYQPCYAMYIKTSTSQSSCIAIAMIITNHHHYRHSHSTHDTSTVPTTP